MAAWQTMTVLEEDARMLTVQVLRQYDEKLLVYVHSYLTSQT